MGRKSALFKMFCAFRKPMSPINFNGLELRVRIRMCNAVYTHMSVAQKKPNDK